MRPAMATCTIDTVATTHAVALQPALGPVAPVHLVAVDGGTAYLALVRSMTCPADRRRKPVSLLGILERENEKPQVYPCR